MYKSALRKDSNVDFIVIIEASIFWNSVHGMELYLGYAICLCMDIPENIQDGFGSIN